MIWENYDLVPGRTRLKTYDGHEGVFDRRTDEFIIIAYRTPFGSYTYMPYTPEEIVQIQDTFTDEPRFQINELRPVRSEDGCWRVEQFLKRGWVLYDERAFATEEECWTLCNSLRTLQGKSSMMAPSRSVPTIL